MPHNVIHTVYKFDELNDKAKEKARDWYRELVFSDSSDWEHVMDDAVEIANLIGIAIDFKPEKLMGGGSHDFPVIYFSGFSSQGDGACFEGSYRYAKGASKAIRDYAPDKELHRIADALAAVQRRHFYQLRATTTQRGHYSHSGYMDVDVQDYRDQYRDLGDDAHAVTQLLRDFADWIYKQLRDEYEFQTSDENVDESIHANGYTFDESGKRFN